MPGALSQRSRGRLEDRAAKTCHSIVRKPPQLDLAKALFAAGIDSAILEDLKRLWSVPSKISREDSLLQDIAWLISIGAVPRRDQTTRAGTR
jgi:hypothetical protein